MTQEEIERTIRSLEDVLSMIQSGEVSASAKEKAFISGSLETLRQLDIPR